MKITYIHQYFSTPKMSGGVRSYEIARHLVEMGHEVNVITSDRDSTHTNSNWYKSIECGINVYWLPVLYSNHFSFFGRIKAFISFAIKSSFKAASFKADVVIATSTPLSIGLPGLYSSFKQSSPLVFEVRDLWPTVPISMGILKNPFLIWASKKFESFVYSRSEAVVALSPGMKKGVVAAKFPKERISVIPNFSDIEMFTNNNQKKNEHSWKFNGPLIVYTGTFGKVNGLKYLVELARELDKIKSNVNIMIVGDGREFKDIVRLAKDYNLLNSNFFIQHSIKKSELPKLLSFADMSCNIVIDNEDIWNNSANKFFDGLASAKPMLINSGGWQAELIEKFKAGIVTYDLSFNDAAKKVHLLLNDKNWKAETGLNSLNLAKKYFSRNKLVNDFEKVLLEASNKNGKAAHIYGFKE